MTFYLIFKRDFKKSTCAFVRYNKIKQLVAELRQLEIDSLDNIKYLKKCRLTIRHRTLVLNLSTEQAHFCFIL